MSLDQCGCVDSTGRVEPTPDCLENPAAGPTATRDTICTVVTQSLCGSKRKKIKKPQPWAHGTDAQVEAYRAAYDRVMVAYDIASAQYRKTGVMCAFPAGTFPRRIPLPMEVT